MTTTTSQDARYERNEIRLLGFSFFVGVWDMAWFSFFLLLEGDVCGKDLGASGEREERKKER